MARIKYAPGEDPLINKHLGYTFQPNNYGQSMYPGAKNDRTRNANQRAAQQNLMKCVRMWREMSAGTKANWESFATTYPQASRRNPAIFLTGYQLFLKRNHYKFLNEGIGANFMESPKMETLPAPAITFTIEQAGNCLDATENYIKLFGIIPAPGQFVLLKAYPMARDSGQFFEPIILTLEILESYIDGLFVSVAFAAGTPAVDLSVYLSKPFYQSVKYAGTKVKYMGCFSGKTFLSLTDTPDDYTGQGEKQVAVKADETGLEFIAGGGGGLTCATLLACPSILSILDSIQNLSDALVPSVNTSLPPVTYGLLYNAFAIDGSYSKSVLRSDWKLLTTSEWNTFIALCGDPLLSGGKLKEPGLTYWRTPNVGASNSLMFNSKGSGYRSDIGGFNYLKYQNRFWLNTASGAQWIAQYTRYDKAFVSYTSSNRKSGYSLRPVKISTSLSHGETGSYVGFNGRIYRTICIYGYEWLADNLAETLFNDYSPIPEITSSAEWAALSTPALCAYGNSWANV